MNDWFEAEQRVQRAYEFYESGRWEEALEELTAALRVNPYQSEWHFYMGLTLDDMGRFEQALHCYEKALEHHQGDDKEILTHLGVDCLRLDFCERAIQYFEQLQQSDPDDELSYVHRIEAYSRLEDHDQAELMFYMACQINDASAPAHFNMAGSLMNRGLSDQAIGCLETVKEIDANHPHLNSRFGRACWMKGRLLRAHRYYLRQLRLDPGDTETMMELGMLLLEMDRPIDAAEKFRRLCELDPTHAAAHEQLGRLSLKRGRLEAAQSSFELVLRLDAARPRIHQMLAEVAMRRGRLEDTRRHLRAELALKRQVEASEKNDDRHLGRLLLDAGMAQQAVAVLGPVAQAHDQDAVCQHHLGLALLADARYREGIVACHRAVRLNRHYTIAMHNLAAAYLRLGQWHRARLWADRALRSDSGHEPTRLLRTRLAVLAVRRFFQRLLGC